VPDLAVIRVGDTYYMSSTTMHMSPGLPIMKSKDLVNWQLVSYAYSSFAATKGEEGSSRALLLGRAARGRSGGSRAPNRLAMAA
jgi:beta-xylosidase